MNHKNHKDPQAQPKKEKQIMKKPSEEHLNAIKHQAARQAIRAISKSLQESKITPTYINGLTDILTPLIIHGLTLYFKLVHFA